MAQLVALACEFGAAPTCKTSFLMSMNSTGGGFEIRVLTGHPADNQLVRAQCNYARTQKRMNGSIISERKRFLNL